MIQVLFVCLGNICRSPMAEAVFRDLVKREGLQDKIFVDSAGTGNWHVGEPPHKGTLKVLKNKGISTDGMKARQIVREDGEKFHYILAMDRKNLRDLKKVVQEKDGVSIQLFLDLVDDVALQDVPDPYFTGNFDEVYELVIRGCEALLKKIKAEHHL